MTNRQLTCLESSKTGKIVGYNQKGVQLLGSPMHFTQLLSVIAITIAFFAGHIYGQSVIKYGETVIKFGPLLTDASSVPEMAIHDVAQDDGSIPEQYWGAQIRALKPLRVHLDRFNIAVVTQQRGNEERGVYFYRTISSYLPHDAPGRTFRWNAQKKQLEYAFTK